MKRALWVLLFVVCCGYQHPARAQPRAELEDVGITGIGSHVNLTFYLWLDKYPPGGCAYGTAYCYSSDPECKARLAIALSAKAQGKRLARMWLDLDASQAVNGAPLCRIANLVFQ
jgi:hypothetical protein